MPKQEFNSEYDALIGFEEWSDYQTQQEEDLCQLTDEQG
mgnify:CR=1 FL=1